MPRKLRLQYPGAVYHVMSRGDRREDIFLNDVEGGSRNGYLKTACDYVYLNPVRARMLKGEERLLSYPWSSFGAYLAAPKHRPSWIRVDRLLGEHGLQKDTAAARQQFEQRMEQRRREETDPEALRALRRGWCLGSSGFRREMLARMEGNLGEHHSGELHRASAVSAAGSRVGKAAKRYDHSNHGRHPVEPSQWDGCKIQNPR